MRRLFRYFRQDPHIEVARQLYAKLVYQARQPGFYTSFAVPDTIDGRFDLIVLHVFLLIRRLKSEGDVGQAMAQSLFDVMFADMDQSLREMGVGDLGVGKRVKVMAAGFYGRCQAYEEGLMASDHKVLEAAISRNLFGTIDSTEAQLVAMATYIRQESRALEQQSASALLTGTVVFNKPVAR